MLNTSTNKYISNISITNEKTRYLKISDSKCIDLYTGDTVLYSRVDYLPTDEEIIELKKKLELTGGESIP